MCHFACCTLNVRAKHEDRATVSLEKRVNIGTEKGKEEEKDLTFARSARAMSDPALKLRSPFSTRTLLVMTRNLDGGRDT